MSGAGSFFLCLEFEVARSDYAGYDIGPFPIRSQLPMCGVFPCCQKFFQNQVARLVTPGLDPLVIVPCCLSVIVLNTL